MLIAQISDLHIAPKGQLTCGVAPMAENLARCVESLNALEPRPDLVLLSGDVTHDASIEETRHAREILSVLKMPLFIVPGNHDDRTILADVFGPDICPTTDDGFVDYVIKGFAMGIIALDSLATGKPGGRICPERLDWLAARLDELGAQPTLLFMHHPPLKLGVPESDEDGFTGAQKLGDIVAAHANVERVLCGHVHLHTNARWRGTMVTTAPSMGMRLTLDLTQQEASRFYLAPPAYLLHHWTAGHDLITHPIQLSDLDGPFDFL